MHEHPAHDRKGAPLFPDEIARLDDKPATEPVPAEVARQLATPRITLASTMPKVHPHLTAVEGADAAWEIRDASHLVVGLPGRSGSRISREEAAAASAGNASRAHRPAWVPHLYNPRRSMAPRRNAMRTIDGRRVEPYYGVFGSDDRQVYYPTGYPWHCIGRIFTWTDASSPNWTWSGSGVLVGPRHVLCAGHLAPWGSGNWMMQFVPGYYDGTSVEGPGAMSYVSDYWGYNTNDTVSAWDMLLLRLYTPLGDQLGWFGSKTYDGGWDNQPYWDLCGYPGAIAGAQRPSYQAGISVLDQDSSGDALEIEHQGDSTAGDSGGPFFSFWADGFPYVVGTVSGGEQISGGFLGIGDEDNNICAGGAALPDLVNWGLTNWP